MISTEATVCTPRASRYLNQLCRHLGHLRDRPHAHPGEEQDRPAVLAVEATGTDATITFDRGRCTLNATADTLTLRVESTDEERLRGLQTRIAHRLESISGRDHLRAVWTPAMSPPQ